MDARDTGQDTGSWFELLPIGAYRSSIDGRQLRANPALVRLNGYDDEAQLLAAVNDIAREWYVDPQRRGDFQQLMRRDGQVTDFVSEVYRHRTRERIWIRENAHVVRDADGAPLYYEGTVEDITPQRRTELALQASERRFRAFTERSQVLTLLCDADSRIRYASPASRRLLGIGPDSMIGRRVTEWVHPEDQALAQQELARVVAEGRHGDETVLRAAHADGSWRHLAVLANNFLADPAIAGVVLNARDVSGRARAEAAMRALNAELEQRVQQRTAELVQSRDAAESANRAKSEFLSRMSHELRTPMHAILGFGRLLERDPALSLPAASRGQLREIVQAGERLLGLIDELLDLARIDAGQLPLTLRPVALRPLLEECLRSLEPLARERGVRLPTLAELPAPRSVSADRERLRQVLLNLLSASVGRNPRGGRLRIGIEPVDGALRIAITDTATPLQPAERELLFHAFERLGQPQRAGEDAGIGLALSRRLVGLMQGRVGLDSGPDGGNRYWLELLAAEAEAPAAAPAAARSEQALHQASGTVLYIEDNPVNVLLMEAMVEQHTRLHMLSAGLPETGLRMAAAHRPDLILLDIQLPGIDGYEVLRRLRASEDTRAIPVVAVSANAMPEDIARGRAAGFDDYLTKPVDQHLLMAVLGRILPRA